VANIKKKNFTEIGFVQIAVAPSGNDKEPILFGLTSAGEVYRFFYRTNSEDAYWYLISMQTEIT
jgi:hypothetical protein